MVDFIPRSAHYWKKCGSSPPTLISMTVPADLTEILLELSSGDQDALDRLIPIVYEELKRIAHGQLRGERSGHTLNTTGLVHEAYIRLVDVQRVRWQDRSHFFAVAARVMRRVLVDHARGRNREKRGGGAVAIPLSEALVVAAERADDLLALDEALERLQAMNERQCQVVECRCFAGLSVEDTAEALGTSTATVKRDWAFARAWLNRELADPTRGMAES